MRAPAIAALGLALMAAKSDPLAGRIAGAPIDCIDLDRVDGPDIVDNKTILYRQSGKRIWKTGPTDSCPGLRFGRTLIVEPTARRLCRGDRFRALLPGTTIPSSLCRFTVFTPYDKP